MISSPNYLIIGTMKGGTTALQDFICAHPNVAVPKQKEIHYFSLLPHMGRDWYLGHFEAPEGQIIGEASPSYFDVAYTGAIPQLIKSFNPKMRLILVVRDPIDRAVSHFHHLRTVNQIEALAKVDVNEFFSRPYQAILRQSTDIDYYLHQTIDFSLYARKLMTYLSVFRDGQLMVVESAKLMNSASVEMARVFRHLGLENYYDRQFEEVKYTSGRSSSELTQAVRDHLREIFDADYAEFWRHANARG